MKRFVPLGLALLLVACPGPSHDQSGQVATPAAVPAGPRPVFLTSDSTSSAYQGAPIREIDAYRDYVLGLHPGMECAEPSTTADDLHGFFCTIEDDGSGYELQARVEFRVPMGTVERLWLAPEGGYGDVDYAGQWFRAAGSPLLPPQDRAVFEQLTVSSITEPVTAYSRVAPQVDVFFNDGLHVPEISRTDDLVYTLAIHNLGTMDGGNPIDERPELDLPAPVEDAPAAAANGGPAAGEWSCYQWNGSTFVYQGTIIFDGAGGYDTEVFGGAGTYTVAPGAVTFTSGPLTVYDAIYPNEDGEVELNGNTPEMEAVQMFCST